MYAVQHVKMSAKPEKESIHSGHFMVSHFEAEEQDDEDNLAVPIPEVIDSKAIAIVPVKSYNKGTINVLDTKKNQQQLAIDTSLSKLFQCMSIAYRQKLTSPKWNRFRGIRLRWKDKIRLNNVIWRCWHLQFIKKENTLICQFASPLDVDTHNKPEAVVLEGKYWKRKLAAVTAEYKKWRMYFRNHTLGQTSKDNLEMLNEFDMLAWDSNSSDNVNMMVDEDYMGLMSDTLFSTIANQPFVFPDSREIAKAGLADFIQPSLGPLQPNLEDYMDTFDPRFDPVQEFMTTKLATVPEEQANQDATYKHMEWGYIEDITAPQLQALPNVTQNHMVSIQYPSQIGPPLPQIRMDKGQPLPDAQQTYTDMSLQQPFVQQPNFSVISKTQSKPAKSVKTERQQRVPDSTAYNKQADNNVYQALQNYVLINDRVQVPIEEASTSQQPQQQQQQQSQSFKQEAAVNDQRGYKFSAPTTPTLKFTTQQVQSQLMQQTVASSLPRYTSPSLSSKEEATETRRRGAPRGRGRSRSNTREPLTRPPLISAVSDPALLASNTSVLLTQLLTNNSDSAIYNQLQTNISSQFGSRNQVRVKEEVAILPQAAPTTLITIPSQVSQVNIQSSTDPLILNTSSPVPDTSSTNIHSPTSSQDSVGSPSQEGSSRDRRVGHIHAEQKRRYNIKNGFDMLHSLIPHLNQNPNAKMSKAAMLQKGAEYIRQLRTERHQLKDEMDSLKQQIESLNTSISNCQSMLPATGAPVSRHRDNKMQEMFDEYVRTRTMENWKFWIFSLIFRPLLNSFNNFVSTSSLEDLYSSTILWVEQHCTLVDLRPVVLNSLRYLCTKTDILSEPEKLPDEARQLVLKPNSNSQNSS